MRKSGSFLCLVCALLCSAPLSAQPLPVRQLEERVAQELLSEGTSLARLGLRLVVRPVEPDIELELVEIESGRLLASRRVTDLPSDTDAAIAHLTVLAGSLVRTVRPDPPPPPPPSPAVAPRIEKPPAPDPLEQAREEYGRRQVGFDDVITVRGWGSVFKVESVGTPYRGTMHAPLR